jgi:hypothetical protein
MGVYVAPPSPDCHERNGIRRAALVAPGGQPAFLGGAGMIKIWYNQGCE